MTYAAGAIGAFAAALAATFHADSPTARNVLGVSMSTRELRAILKRLLGSRYFWLAGGTLTTSCVVKRTLELLLPLYFFDTSASVSQGQAAQLATVWSAGLAASVLGGGWLFNRLGNRRKMALLATIMSLTVAGCVTLAGLSTTIADTRAEVAVRASAPAADRTWDLATPHRATPCNLARD